jgi:hypothetical protein
MAFLADAVTDNGGVIPRGARTRGRVADAGALFPGIGRAWILSESGCGVNLKIGSGNNGTGISRAWGGRKCCSSVV